MDMNNCYRILVTDRLDLEALSLIQAQKNFIVKTDSSLDSADSFAPNALIIRSRISIQIKDIDKLLPHLKVIVSATSGFDHIDILACQERGIIVMNCPEGNAQSVAELTIALMLSCARKTPTAFQQTRQSTWSRDGLMGFDLQYKNLSLIGCGRIGQRVARLAQSFDMNVSAFDPYIEDSIFQKNNIKRVSLEEALLSCDILSLHVPYTKETHHIINASTLTRLSSNTILINTSRGSVVDEESICNALDKGRLYSVGLDVFAREPLSLNSRLLKFPNIVLTPHIGALTTEAFKKVSLQAVEKIVKFFIKNEVSDVLPNQFHSHWWKK